MPLCNMGEALGGGANQKGFPRTIIITFDYLITEGKGFHLYFIANTSKDIAGWPQSFVYNTPKPKPLWQTKVVMLLEWLVYVWH